MSEVGWAAFISVWRLIPYNSNAFNVSFGNIY